MPSPATNAHAFRVMPGDAPPVPAVTHRTNSPDLSAQLAAGGNAVVCCALDTDPTVPLNAAVVAAAADDVLAGVAALAAKVGGRPKVLVVADPDSPAWATLRSKVARPARLVPLHNDYPQAHPSLLLFSLLRRRLPPGRLPTDVGVVLVDAAAAADVGRPPGDSLVRIGVRDHFGRQTHLLAVPDGTPIADVLRFVGVDPAAAAVRAGEFLRDQFVSADTPVTAAGERTFHAVARVTPANPDPCVRCGWCVEACPTRVHPAGLLDAAQRGDPALAARYGLAGCIECGICTYVCPTRLPLLAGIRDLRRTSAPAPAVRHNAP